MRRAVELVAVQVEHVLDDEIGYVAVIEFRHHSVLAARNRAPSRYLGGTWFVFATIMRLQKVESLAVLGCRLSAETPDLLAKGFDRAKQDTSVRLRIENHTSPRRKAQVLEGLGQGNHITVPDTSYLHDFELGRHGHHAILQVTHPSDHTRVSTGLLTYAQVYTCMP